jgi:hypothetical protein
MFSCCTAVSCTAVACTFVLLTCTADLYCTAVHRAPSSPPCCAPCTSLTWRQYTCSHYCPASWGLMVHGQYPPPPPPLLQGPLAVLYLQVQLQYMPAAPSSGGSRLHRCLHSHTPDWGQVGLSSLLAPAGQAIKAALTNTTSITISSCTCPLPREQGIPNRLTHRTIGSRVGHQQHYSRALQLPYSSHRSSKHHSKCTLLPYRPSRLQPTFHMRRLHMPHPSGSSIQRSQPHRCCMALGPKHMVLSISNRCSMGLISHWQVCSSRRKVVAPTWN